MLSMGFIGGLCTASARADAPLRSWKYQQKLGMFSAQQGDFKGALKHLQQALKQAHWRLGPLHPRLLFLLADRLALYRYLGDFKKAEADAFWAMALARRAGSEDQRMQARLNLAELHIDLAHFDEALILLYPKQTLFKKKWAAPVAVSRARLAREQGDFAQAAQQLEIAFKILNTEKKDTQAAEDLQLQAGRDRLHAEQVKKAQQHFKSVLAARTSRLPALHVDRASPLEGLALCAKKQDKPADAVNYQNEAADLRRRTLGPNRWQSLPYLHPAGLLYLNQGKYKKAAAMLKRVAKIYSKAQGKNHPIVASVKLSIAKAYEGLGKQKAARREREAALKILKKSLDETHPRIRAVKKLLNHF